MVLQQTDESGGFGGLITSSGKQKGQRGCSEQHGPGDTGRDGMSGGRPKLESKRTMSRKTICLGHRRMILMF